LAAKVFILFKENEVMKTDVNMEETVEEKSEKS
jgi:hypothetical protein